MSAGSLWGESRQPRRTVASNTPTTKSPQRKRSPQAEAVRVPSTESKKTGPSG
ncbi:hypothetical protein ZHAS_00018359 [Anopheles sinensis]|uniref:Uncharacterized protein n=1 Tax=Anopheles sinensis TaxID=74873 RepID=A0A084WHM1_ANOSI|nr:hypothetical protein ZHAS_00018359 [Anopheles sinensis]